MLDRNLGVYSWDDFIATAARRLTQPPLPGTSDSDVSIPASREWDDRVGFEGAIKLAKEGWQSGVKELSIMLDKLPPDAEVLPDWNTDVCGFVCNVPAFVAGEPECMWRMSECKRSERRLAIFAPNVMGVSISAKVALNYSTALAALVRGMEASGLELAVYAVGTGKNIIAAGSRAPRFGYAVIAKDFGSPLDLSRVGFAFHPAFSRRIGLAWRSMTPAAVEALASNAASGAAGVPFPIDVEIAKQLAGDVGNIVCLPQINDLRHGDTSPEGLLKIFKSNVDGLIAKMQ